MKRNFIALVALLAVTSCGPAEGNNGNNGGSNNGGSNNGGSNNGGSNNGGSNNGGSNNGGSNNGGSNNGGSNNGAAQTLCESTDRLAILDSMVERLMLDAGWVHTNSHGQERGYALSLPATNAGALGTALAFMPCTEAVDFDPYCEPNADIELSQCLRMGCESAETSYMDVYFTDGTTQSPDEEASVSYDAAAPHTEVTWSVRPLRRWRHTDTAEGLTVSAKLDHRVVVDGDLDLTHVGNVEVSDVGTEHAVTTVSLSFTGLLDSAETVELTVTHDDTALTGALTHGDESITLTETGFDWAGGCP